MDYPVDELFYQICKQIISEDKSLQEWAVSESDDMFQNERYCGGFDADEMMFCFSFYNDDNKEYWFQVSYDDIRDIVSGKKNKLAVKDGERTG
jgi:hypothetical protein